MIETVAPPAIIQLNRLYFDDKSTIGELLIDRQFLCHTLEDTVRRVKKFGETAIPSGRYRVVLDNHPKHGFVPHLLNVPFYDGILIHAGNERSSTLGCILVGHYDRERPDWIGQSRMAFAALMDRLQPLALQGEMWIQICGGVSADEMRAA